MSAEMTSVMGLPESLRRAAAEMAIKSDEREVRLTVRSITSAAKRGATPDNIPGVAKALVEQAISMCDERDRACAVLAERSPLDKMVAHAFRKGTATLRTALRPFVVEEGAFR